MSFLRGICRSSTETIAKRIAEHCLNYFVLAAAPRIMVEEEDGSDRVTVNSFATEALTHATEEQIDIDGHMFSLRHVRAYSKRENQHRVLYCGQRLVVRTDPLKSDLVANIEKRIDDGKGDDFVYLAYVSGTYLDERIAPERNAFVIPEADELRSEGELAWPDLRTPIGHAIAAYLSPYTEKVYEQKKCRVEKYIRTNAPQYLPVLSYRPQVIDDIPADATDERMDTILHRAQAELHHEARTQTETFIGKNWETIADAESFTREYARLCSFVTACSQAELAQYVIHRRLIIELLGNALKLQATGKYPLEEAVHAIVYPMRVTSDAVVVETDHNLWLIDERLSYHRYLASDCTHRVSGTPNTDFRPDLLVGDILHGGVFDQAHVYGEDGLPYQSLLMVEFKRPMRDDYDDVDNPIDQVLEYIDRLQTSKVTDRHGRPINVTDATRYYCYIIADITDNLRKAARRSNLGQTPDSMGYFGYNQEYRAYIEIISFSKLHQDAAKRSRALFDKLHLPDAMPGLKLAATSKPANSSGSEYE